MTLRVCSLHVFPVKSFRGIDLDAAELTKTGLRHDRSWLVVDDRNQFLSQRRLPSMARITTRLLPDGLELRCDGHRPVRVPFCGESGKALVTEVWGDRCEVVDEGDAVATWMAKALDTPFTPRLVRMAPAYVRPQKHPVRYGADTRTHFADSAPFLVTATSSLARLNESLLDGGHGTVPMDRFRPNVVIEGLAAFEEHGIEALDGPGYRLALRYPRERCVMTTLDQATGARDPSGEPFQTLRRINPMPDNPKGPAFGELAVLENGGGSLIRVGDQLRPFARSSD